MRHETITGDMRVWNVLQEHPETYEVFRHHGCPDMRKGIYALSAHLMKVKWAAKMHHIEPDKLLHDLNAAAEKAEGEEGSLH